jgi:hypothetical protein
MKIELQCYRKINGIININFGTQVSPGTKIRIHNVVVKATMKYGGKVCMFKKRNTEETERGR